MLLIAQIKKELKKFAINELKPLCKNIIELNEEFLKIDSNIKNIIENSFFVNNLFLLLIEFKTIKDVKNVDFKKYLTSSDSFKIKCNERNVCIDLGQIIKDSCNCQVSLDNPDKTFFVEKIKDTYYCFLEIQGAKNLSKRGYAGNNNEFIPADYAKAMVDFSNYNGKGIFLDSFCHEGYIIIECALKLLQVGPAYFNSKKFDFEFSEPVVKPLENKLLCYSDSMADLKFAKQNAKTSKTFKFIKFGFATLNDIDYNLNENSIDYFVSALPKNIDYEKLFFQLEYIMNKKGIIVFLIPKKDDIDYEKFNFKLIEQINLNHKKIVKLTRI